jgi:hypothetical protein
MARSLKELDTQPCRFMLKEMPARPIEMPNPEYNSATKQITQQSTTPGKIKVLKKIQRTDENGVAQFKTVQVEVKKGCGCGGKKQTVTIEERKIPDIIEVWVEENAPVQAVTTPSVPEKITVNEKQILCKLYGTVVQSYCLRCKTYQK